MMIKQILAGFLGFCLAVPAGQAFAQDPYRDTGFELAEVRQAEDLGGMIYDFKHIKTGAEVVYLDNGAQRRDFSIGFKTPPADSKGANHVLEHSLLCGSEKYPVKNIMHYVRGNALAETINAVTADDCTYYEIKTPNEKEYYNLIDIYMNGIFHPLLLTDENIFKQQGIRLEYVDGQVQYNGIVYNELRIKSLEGTENSVNFVSEELYRALYGDTTPACSSGGNIEEIKTLTYEDVLEVYHTYYTPSNSMTYLAGEQDVRKTLAVLDGFFKEFEKQDIAISFPDTKRQPEEKITEYYVTADTQTVDIGFMSSGVPMGQSAEELYAREIIYNLISEKMNQYNSKNYTSGGNSGGVSNLALLVSEVPVEKKDEMISAYEGILKQFLENGFGDIDKIVDNYISQRQNPYLYAPELEIFNGILYHEDPFYYNGISEAAETLKNSPEIFDQVLKKYFIENPCRKIIISGNQGDTQEDAPLSFGDSEIEKIKEETRRFQEWADQPDDPQAVADIPALTLEDIGDAPVYASPVHETAEMIDFYHTMEQDGENGTVELFFPVQVSKEELGYLQLLTGFLNNQLMEAGFTHASIDLTCMEDYKDPGKINPQICIYLAYPTEAIGEELEKIFSFLQAESVWDESCFYQYIEQTPSEILQNGYRDPYYLSYELKQSNLSAGSAFYAVTRGSTGQGSLNYYHFLKSAAPENYPQILKKVRGMCGDMILNSIPTVEYIGTSGYALVKQVICNQFQDAVKKGAGNADIPIGYYSAAVITTLEDANHFMLSGKMEDTGYTYSGKMNVVGSVLTANYILPVMRGKYGAYGANVMLDQTGITCAVAGMGDIDLAVEVWEGMGDYLRTLDMTQKELDAVIIQAVKEYDMYYNDSDYGAILALTGKTAEDIKRVRDEILSTTVEDIRGYADFVDELVAQKRVFAVLGKNAADQAVFDFAYYANADTLDVFPRFTKNPGRFISGKSETKFSPDDCLTRAEAAQMIANLLADQRGPQGISIYADVTKSDWYYDAVVSLTEKGIMHGYHDGSFQPGKSISRAEFAAALAGFLYDEKTDLEVGYIDMEADDWFYIPMAKMAGGGFLTGYEGRRICPEQPITRAEAVTVLNRMLGKSAEPGMTNPFVDTQGHWAYDEIAAAVN